MNPLDYASLDASLHTWAPPTKPSRTIGAQICVVQPHFARVAISGTDDTLASNVADSTVLCTGRRRTHLPTPHAASCPLDYTGLYVNLHRRQKEKLMQLHAGRPVPLLGRQFTMKAAQPTERVAQRAAAGAVSAARGGLDAAEMTTAAAPPPQEQAQRQQQRQHGGGPVATSAHRATLPDGLTVVERVVPASVAAVMAQVTGSTAAAVSAAPVSASGGAVTRSHVSSASPHHHHHHHHHHHRHPSQVSHPRASAETRAPSTQHSPIMPQHHHHHYQQTPQRPPPQTASEAATAASPQAVAPPQPQSQPQPQPQQQPQHMRYRVGRSGSTQLQSLPTTTNGESVLMGGGGGGGVGAAGLVAAAAVEAAAREVAASVRRVAATVPAPIPGTTATAATSTTAAAAVATSRRAMTMMARSQRRSTSPFSSVPREASTTPLSMALSSIRRSGTRGSSTTTTTSAATGITAAGFAPRLARPSMRAVHRGSLPRAGSDERYDNTGLHSVDDVNFSVDDSTMAAAADSANAAFLMETPNGLADTRMFLRPPEHALRDDVVDYASEELHAAVLLAGTPGALTSTLYRSGGVSATTLTATATTAAVGGLVVDMSSTSGGAGAAVTRRAASEGAGASSIERQRELQLQLQRALQRQRRLERLMFHDSEDENTLLLLRGENNEGEAEEDGSEGGSTDGTEGRRSSHRCRSGTGWDDGLGDDGDAAEEEPLWRASPHTQSFQLHSSPVIPTTTTTIVSASDAETQSAEPADRMPSVHPHQHISLSRFCDAAFNDDGEDDRSGDGGGLGIRADSVLDVPRGWLRGGASRAGGRGRSSTTSPSPQPDPAWTRWQRRQQTSGSAATTVEGSPVPTPAVANPATTTTTAAAAAGGRSARTTTTATNATDVTYTPGAATDMSNTSYYPFHRSGSEGVSVHTAAHLSTPSATLSRSAAMAPTSSHRAISVDSDQLNSDADSTRRAATRTAISPSVLSIMTATVRGPSSMSYPSPSLPQQTEVTQNLTNGAHQRDRPHNNNEDGVEQPGREVLSPSLPSPMQGAVLGNCPHRPSMPNAAFMDIVRDMTAWRESSGDQAATTTCASPAALITSDALPVRRHAAALPASAVASSSSSSSQNSSLSPSWRHSSSSGSPQVDENSASAFACTRQPLRAALPEHAEAMETNSTKGSSAAARVAAQTLRNQQQQRQSSPSPAQCQQGDVPARRGRRAASSWDVEDKENDTAAESCNAKTSADKAVFHSSTSPSFPTSRGSDSPSPSVRVDADQRRARASSSFREMDEAADSEVPTVRRTSPGVSAPSSKCTRLTVDDNDNDDDHDHDQDHNDDGSADMAEGSCEVAESDFVSRKSDVADQRSDERARGEQQQQQRVLPLPDHVAKGVADVADVVDVGGNAAAQQAEVADAVPTTAPRSNCFTAPAPAPVATPAAPMLYLADMLRLSLSPGRDDTDDPAYVNENGTQVDLAAATHVDTALCLQTSAATPPRPTQQQPASRYFTQVDGLSSRPHNGGECFASEGVTDGYPQRSSDYFYNGERRTTTDGRSGLGTASISSSPPSPNRTAIRHAASLLTDGDEDAEEGEDPLAEERRGATDIDENPNRRSRKGKGSVSSFQSSPLSMSSPFSRRRTPIPAFPGASTPLTPTTVANRLALSMDEPRLQASTASTVAWGTTRNSTSTSSVVGQRASAAGARSSFAAAAAALPPVPRFSDDSVLFQSAATPTTSAADHLPRASANSSRSSTSEVFSTPAQARVQSLLRASTWAATSSPAAAITLTHSPAKRHGNVQAEEDEDKHCNSSCQQGGAESQSDADLCTPRRWPTESTSCVGGRGSAEMRLSGVLSAPATPLQPAGRDSLQSVSASSPTAVVHISAMMPPPPPPYNGYSPSNSAAMMPPSQPSPFRGSGSFLRVQPCWSSCQNNNYANNEGGEEGRPSDGFEADIQLLARMTRMTMGNTRGNASASAAAPMPPSTTFHTPEKQNNNENQSPHHQLQPQQQQQHPQHQQSQHDQPQVSSPSASPQRYSTNSLSFFIAAAATNSTATPEGPALFTSPGGTGPFDEPNRGSGSGVYGSAVASRRSWAPRKGRPERRGKQYRTRGGGAAHKSSNSSHTSSHRTTALTSASRSVDPHHQRQLRFTTELTSSSPSSSVRWSRNEDSGVFLAPQRLTFGSVVASAAATHVTASQTEGASDSGERWSTAQSTPNGVFLASSNLHVHPQQQQHQQQQQQFPRPSPPSYFESFTGQLSASRTRLPGELSEKDEGLSRGLRSPSLSSMHAPDPVALMSQQPQQQQQMMMWSQQASTSPRFERTPSGRPSLSSTEFLRAPQRGYRGNRRGSATPSVHALPSYRPTLNEVGDASASQSNLDGNSGVVVAPSDFRGGSSARQRSLSTSGEGSDTQSWAGRAPQRRPRHANRATSFSQLRSPSVTATRLTWGTTTASSLAGSEARPAAPAAALSFSPVHSGRLRSPSNSINFNSGRTTPLRVSRSRTSGLMMDRVFAMPTVPTHNNNNNSTVSAAMGAAHAATTAAAAGVAAPPLSLADELRSFSSPLFGMPTVAHPPPPPVSSSLTSTTSMPAPAPVSFFHHPTGAFIASPARRAGLQHPQRPVSGAAGATALTSLPPELQGLLMPGRNAATPAVGSPRVRPPPPPLFTESAPAEEFKTPQRTRPSGVVVGGAVEDTLKTSPPSGVKKTPQQQQRQRRGCSERPEVNVEYGAAASPSPSRQASP